MYHCVHSRFVFCSVMLLLLKIKLISSFQVQFTTVNVKNASFSTCCAVHHAKMIGKLLLCLLCFLVVYKSQAKTKALIQLQIKTDSSLTWYTYLPQELTAEEGVVFFDPESPFFQKMLNICAGLLAAACLFGIIYHLVFYKPIQRKKHGTFYACI